MDITKCLYLTNNNRYTDPWEKLKKNFDYISRTFTAKKYEPPRPTYMRLDSTGSEDDRTVERGNIYNSMPVNAENPLTGSNHINSVDMKTSRIMGSGAPTKPKRSRNGFVTLYQFWGGFVGTKSLNSARTEPSLLKDVGRPTFNVGNIFEMYQESCLVEDSIRNSRKCASELNKTMPLSQTKSTHCSAPQINSEELEVNIVDATDKPVDAVTKIENIETLEDTVIGVSVDVTQTICAPNSTSLPFVQPNVDMANVILPTNQDTEPKSSGDESVTNISYNLGCAVSVPEKRTPGSSVNIANDMIQCNVDVKNGLNLGKQCNERARKQKRRRSNGNKIGFNSSVCSEEQLNMKNKILAASCISPSYSSSSYDNFIPKPVDFNENTAALSQKRVNDHAASKTQKRCRKRSRRKARRQRKNSSVAPQNNSVDQQSVSIPNENSDVASKSAPKVPTPSHDEVDTTVSKPVTTPICFVQPLCANAAIAFILGVCSDDSDSEDDGDGCEWEISGDDNWEKSNDLWESFQQCAQLHLSNLKYPVIATSATCGKETISTDLDSDEVDGASHPTNPLEETNGHEHLSREYPNANQLTAEQLNEVNKRWLNEVEKDVVPRVIRNSKKVYFPEGSDLVQVRRLCTWSYAHQAARKGQWEQYARDRSRFQTRIKEVEKNISYIFAPEHRTSVYQKYYGFPSSSIASAGVKIKRP